MRRCVSALLTASLLIACTGCFWDVDRVRFDNPDSRKFGETGESTGRGQGEHGEQR